MPAVGHIGVARLGASSPSSFRFLSAFPAHAKKGDRFLSGQSSILVGVTLWKSLEYAGKTLIRGGLILGIGFLGEAKLTNKKD